MGKRFDKKSNMNFKIYDITTWETITIQASPNISRKACNQAMKFGKLIDYNVKNIFLQTSCRNEEGRLIPDIFWFFKKALRGKSGLHLRFNIFR